MYNIIENNFFNRLPIELVYKIINYIHIYNIIKI